MHGQGISAADVSKGDTRFCTASRIEPETLKALGLLDEAEALLASPPDFIAKLAECYGDLNMVHPFREGNGRTQRLFFEHWLLVQQFGADWRKTDRDEWTAACIAAVTCDYAPLETILDRCISPIDG